ncbi:recombinase family protein [Mesorhizobium sp. M1005]|uniref:recombinase family protein n=1 Tax=Mesorhizobium sp. M1005 TaxID=2957047 RepID=UPI003339FE05
MARQRHQVPPAFACLSIRRVSANEDNNEHGQSEYVDWRKAIRYIREGDPIMVWKLDRFGRSMKHLIDIVTKLDAKGLGFRSIAENIDITHRRRLVFQLFGALAQSEHDLVRKTALAGLQGRRLQKPVSIWRPSWSFDKPSACDDTQNRTFSTNRLRPTS